MVEQFGRNTTYFLQEEYALDSPFEQEVSIGNVADDDTHVLSTTEFQAMIDDLHRLNSLVGQRFDKRMVAQAKAKSKQLKFLAEKTKAMFEYAQAMIDEVDEKARAIS